MAPRPTTGGQGPSFGQASFTGKETSFPLPGSPPGAPELPQGSPTPAKDLFLPPPAVELPRGGGAIRGIGEKFQANPVTGTGSMSVPIATSPGRGGFGPQLSLSYDSGGGNSPFGHGWRVGIPSIRRKTDKGLPTYRDGVADGSADEDTFVFSEAEDLVPLLEPDGSDWVPVTRVESGWRVVRYRPRVEGAFARIERWTNQSTGDTYWRTVSGDNMVRLYGQSTNARVADPADSSRTFEWLLEEVRDEVGNRMRYEYKHEDRVGVSKSAPYEWARVRSGVAYAYPKRVFYGNATPGTSSNWKFELVFDYGEHHTTVPTPSEAQDWAVRSDPYSSFRSGFDQRCYRLCQRVLMFHRISDLSANPVLVRSTDLTHEASAHLTKLTQVVQRGWKPDGSGGYTTEAMPRVAFGYSEAVIGQQVQLVDGLDDLPQSLDLSRWQWMDLDGEGLNGLLTEQGGAWFFKRNEGEGTLGAIQRLPERPGVSLGSGARLLDLGGDGKLDIVQLTRPMAGYQERDADGSWGRFHTFDQVPEVDWSDPNVRVIDLDGDGHADLLVTEHEAFRWYPSKAKDGYGAAHRVRKAHDEEDGPKLLFSSEGESIFLADMSGDGLVDLVRVRNRAVCYWPNLGYGRFGKKITMAGAPAFDSPDRFDPGRVQLADVDGSGPADLVYLGPKHVRIWRNASGNSFASPDELTRLPGVDSARTVQVADLLGDGTACLVWSSPLLGDRVHALRYVRLMSEGKPHLLVNVDNGLGRETRLTYAPSTKFYLADRRAGHPWATRLSFPVQCVETVTVLDHVTGWKFSNRYAYHHGTFDGAEREFRGFGMVEQWDTESVSDFEGATNGAVAHYVDPVRTRTWFHTGVLTKHRSLLDAYASEYWSGDTSAASLPSCSVPEGLSPEERRQAYRALRGRVLRQEVFSDDESGDADKPYTVTQTTYGVRRLQPQGEHRHASFLVVDDQTLSWSYERNASDPRVSHSLALDVDDYGKVVLSAAVSYPRRSPVEDEQGVTSVLVTETDLIHDDSSDDQYHLALAYQTRLYELSGLDEDDTSPLTVDGLNSELSSATEIDFEDAPTGSPTVEKRLLQHTKTLYWNDALTGSQTEGTVGSRALVYESYALALTPGLVSNVYGTTVTSTDLTNAGYELSNSAWWVRSGRNRLVASHFYQPDRHSDPFGNTTEISWDSHDLAITEVEDAVGNTVSADIDYRTLAPWRLTDANGQKSEVALDELGRVTEMAVVGKAGEGDTLSAPTVEHTYELGRWLSSGVPARVHTRRRETHDDTGTRWLKTYAYSDGGGSVVVTKSKVEGGLAPERDGNGDLVYVSEELQFATTTSRWVGSGRTVLDNKGNPVKQYEPYFDSQAEFTPEEELDTWGVSPVLQYDPVGRNVRTDFPDGTFTMVTFDGWSQKTYDAADTVDDSDWYTTRQALSSSHPDHRASDLSHAHYNTPLVMVLDALGRPFLTQQDNDDTSTYDTHVKLDIEGNPLEVTDARGNATQSQVFDLLGRPLKTDSADAGATRVLPDVASQPVKTWRPGSLTIRREYDALRRLTHNWVDEGSGERLAEYFVYGDALIDLAAADNHKGRLFRTYDGAGLLEVGSYDFKGNPNSTTRTLLSAVTAEVDWSAVDGDTTESALNTNGASNLQSSGHTTSTTYDALDRPVTQTTPDSSVTRYGYDAGGSLLTVDVDVRGATPTTAMVTDITYDARGRRLSIDYGNDTATAYTYDALSQRLTRIHTTRDSDSADLQDLRYFYDAVGNIVEVQDQAQETLFFDNTQVDPTGQFVYDALYRLTQAKGREKVGLAQAAESSPAYGVVPEPTTTVLRRYTRNYTYDAVGNITQMAQVGDWTRNYSYASTSNRLVSNSAPGGGTHSYSYTARGAMSAMPHLSAMTRDWRDQLRQVSLGGGDSATYHYDANGQRVRKVVELGANTHERVYLGSWELYDKSVSGTLDDQRETLHVFDDQRRVAMVETLTVSGGSTVGSPTPRFRYQLDNHLGTACLEVDDSALVITYEEFHPYGTTAWHAEKSGIQVSKKRYRYTGMERDDETGLALHGVRFYAPWLGRWASADPGGMVDGSNRYRYAGGRPVGSKDPSGHAEVQGSAGSQVAGWNKIIADIEQMPESSFFDRPKKTGLRALAEVGRGLGALTDAAMDPVGTAMGTAPGHAIDAYSKAGGGLAGVLAAEESFFGYGPTVAAPTTVGMVAETGKQAFMAPTHQQELGFRVVAGQPTPGESLRARALEAGGIGDGQPLSLGDKTSTTLHATESELLLLSLAAGAASPTSSEVVTIASPTTGNPRAIYRGFGELSSGQAAVLEQLEGFGSRTIVGKRSFGLNDLSALTAATGDEFAMFTTGGRRMVMRGGPEGVPVTPDMMSDLAAQGWRWSGHSHPGGASVLRASEGDLAVLRASDQTQSVIMNSEGSFRLFGVGGDMLTGWLP